MSATKRPAQEKDELEQDGPRKSQRKSRPPQRLGFLPVNGDRSEQDLPPVTKHEHLEQKTYFQLESQAVNRGLNAHNNLLAFINDTFPTTKSFVISQQRIREARARADRIMRQAEMQIKEAESRVQQEYSRILENEYYTVLPGICNEPYWWERGDIFTLKLSQLQLAIMDYVPDNAARFTEYLVRMTREYLSQKAIRLFHNPSKEFLQKVALVWLLLRRSKDSALDYHCFRFGVYLLVGVFPHDNMKNWGGEVYVGYKSIRSYMGACLQDRTGSSAATIEEISQKYLDASTAFHHLLMPYDSHKSKCQDEFNDRRDGGYLRQKCFHERHIALLKGMLKRAHQEVRASAMLAVSKHIPVELVDLVKEFALTAERLPHTTVIRGLPVYWENAPSVTIGSMVGFKTLHGRYQCAHMMNYSPRERE